MIIILARQYSLDDGSLIGVEDVGLVPLEEDVVHWYFLTSHEVARVVCRLHGESPFTLIRKSAPLKSGMK